VFNDSHTRGQLAPFRQCFGSSVAVGKLPDELLNGKIF
jgi:hypothetical protein